MDLFQSRWHSRSAPLAQCASQCESQARSVSSSASHADASPLRRQGPGSQRDAHAAPAGTRSTDSNNARALSAASSKTDTSAHADNAINPTAWIGPDAADRPEPAQGSGGQRFGRLLGAVRGQSASRDLRRRVHAAEAIGRESQMGRQARLWSVSEDPCAVAGRGTGRTAASVTTDSSSDTSVAASAAASESATATEASTPATGAPVPSLAAKVAAGLARSRTAAGKQGSSSESDS